MTKVPKNPEEAFGEITDDFKKVFGSDLVSIILYGSGASGHYVPGKSDLNFFVILSKEGIDNLGKAIDSVARWQKRKVAIPIFMTKEEILSSLDCYPVEFLSMKRHYVVVYGEDVLGGLSFEPRHLRLQIERELKGKILHLRRGLLEAEGRAKRVRELIQSSFIAFISIFKALLHFNGIDIPHSRRDIIQAVAKAYSINADVFLKCADIKEDNERVPASEVITVFKDYMKELERLSEEIDRMDV
ncbi:MAG TPA: hypothetical protein VEI57_05825 [Nitrospirota bacterium]|nr:hypothetical protein [Nitrospirota bacterium]